jgi:hypothetical protein
MSRSGQWPCNPAEAVGNEHSESPFRSPLFSACASLAAIVLWWILGRYCFERAGRKSKPVVWRWQERLPQKADDKKFKGVRKEPNRTG